MNSQHADITLLNLDHPGASDPVYRARRDEIACAARLFRHTPNIRIPRIGYTAQEHSTWSAVMHRLDPLHRRLASPMYLQAKRALKITQHEIPELCDLNDQLRGRHQFGLAPIEGLIDTRTFLCELGQRTMLCTQYIRHASKPEYTPEPDIVHEVVGHVPMFTNKDLVDFTVSLGRAATHATDDQIEMLARLYWFTIEFGLIEDAGDVKAFGAGLLSSIGEIQHAFSDAVDRRPFDVKEIVETPYDFSHMQSRLFVIPAFSMLREASERFLIELGL